MTEFKVSKPTPYYLQFYSQIKKMIFEGTLQQGSRINETQLAKDFGVSRSPVREAMRLLEKDGLLIADDKNGFTVYTLSIKDVEEIYQIRMALESLAVERVIEEANKDNLLAIETQLQQAEDAINRKAEEKTIIELNKNFHHLLVDLSNNRHLSTLLDNVNVLIYFCRVLNFRNNRASEILSEHKLIFAEIKNGDKQAAKQVMVDHLTNDLTHLKKVLLNAEAVNNQG
ncbi:GntR family transcriptional regulator [Shouchella patagoniensis]|uniref:GntR family transcriptional regulator n=1 Tax=Shouchella patagoniensis TaxID=228576 RepID=UPI000994E980|nr:GntR family transcriptional regulator [Shouchella patagoniensis]